LLKILISFILYFIHRGQHRRVHLRSENDPNPDSHQHLLVELHQQTVLISKETQAPEAAPVTQAAEETGALSRLVE
jgi:hypothetical protein